MKTSSIMLLDRPIGVMSIVIYLVFVLSMRFVKTSHLEFMMGK